MNTYALESLRARFTGVAHYLGDGLAAASPRVVALVAKWSQDDLVPGLSDLDFRVVCDDAATPDDWVQIDRHVGRIHRQMVADHPEWNRINEHTAGAGVVLEELRDARFHHPEYSVWTVWWGRDDWADHLVSRTLARPLAAIDEHYHLSRFLAYFSPYIHGIDPPINLGEFEPKYALHSRCWHYYAPPILSAATLLARRHFRGKREALQWLIDEGIAAKQTAAVLAQVDAHYDTPEKENTQRLERFEQLLFTAFEELLEPVCDSIELLKLPSGASRRQLQEHLAEHHPDPLVELLELVRFARIRAGRYYFYLNAPAHFSAERQIVGEHSWTKMLVKTMLKTLRELHGAPQLSPAECFTHLGIEPGVRQLEALHFMVELADQDAANVPLRSRYSQAIELFPEYYLLAEEACRRLHASEQRGGKRGRVNGAGHPLAQQHPVETAEAP